MNHKRAAMWGSQDGAKTNEKATRIAPNEKAQGVDKEVFDATQTRTQIIDRRPQE